jgi:hypothetical protein
MGFPPSRLPQESRAEGYCEVSDPMSIAVATVATAAVRLLVIRYAVNQSSL